MIPAAPLVGAVTIRPPPAFSSDTAKANKSTHAASDDSSTASARFLSRASTSLFEASLAYIFGALRGAFKPPGNTVCDVWHPCCTQRRITRHTLSSSLRTCTADCMAVSLAHTMSAILIWCFSHNAMSSSHDVNGYGTSEPSSSEESLC